MGHFTQDSSTYLSRLVTWSIGAFSTEEKKPEPKAAAEEDEDSEPKAKKKKKDKHQADPEKLAALEAEVKAARERALVPLEIRQKQFRDMLLERGVSQQISLYMGLITQHVLLSMGLSYLSYNRMLTSI